MLAVGPLVWWVVVVETNYSVKLKLKLNNKVLYLLLMGPKAPKGAFLAPENAKKCQRFCMEPSPMS